MLAFFREQSSIRSVRSLLRIGIPEDKALKAATAMSKRDDDVSTLKGDLLLIKWMMGFVLAFQVAIAVKLFLH